MTWLQQETRLGVDKVKPKGWFWGCWDFRFWGLGLLAEDGGLLQVLPLTVRLKFLAPTRSLGSPNVCLFVCLCVCVFVRFKLV